MKIFKTLLLFCLPFSVLAQNVEDNLMFEKVPVGIYANGDTIYADHYSVDPYIIIDYRIDDSNRYLYLTLCTKINPQGIAFGRFSLCFDLINKTTRYIQRFSEDVHYIKNYRDYIVTHVGPEDAVVINKSGDKKKKGKFVFTIDYVDETAGIGLSYNGYGVDMKTFKTIWENPIDRSNGVLNLRKIDSLNVIVTANGLRKLNLLTGEGWYIPFRTGVTEKVWILSYKEMPVYSLYKVKGKQKSAREALVIDMCSRPIRYNNVYYMAGAEEVVAVDTSGKLLWKRTLPSDHTGSSDLQILGNNLVVLNKGFAYSHLARTYTSTPYVAAYDMNSGKLQYSHVFDSSIMIVECGIDNDTLHLLTDKQFAILDGHTGKIIKESYNVPVDSILFGGYNDLVWRGQLFDSSMKTSFSVLYPHTYYLESEGKGLIQFDENLNVSRWWPAKKYYYRKTMPNGTYIYIKGKKAVIAKGQTKLATFFKYPDLYHDKLLIKFDESEITICPVPE